MKKYIRKNIKKKNYEWQTVCKIFTSQCIRVNITSNAKKASVHVSMSVLYIYLGVLLIERVAYDFSVSLCASLLTSIYYSDDLRCLLYLFSFGHVFFRANANCRLYQIADSTETPLLAQVLSLLSFSFAFFTSFLVIVLSHAWPEFIKYIYILKNQVQHNHLHYFSSLS